MWLYRSATVGAMIILALFLAACNGEGLKLVVAPSSLPSGTPTPQGQPGATQPTSSLSTHISPLATPVTGAAGVATPNAGKGGLVGRLRQFGSNKPLANQNLSLPAIVCPPNIPEENKREQCIYVIDDAFDPSVLTDTEGRFVFQNIAAGEYILLVGNRVTRYTILTDELNQPLIWKIEADKVIDLGDLVVELR